MYLISSITLERMIHFSVSVCFERDFKKQFINSRPLIRFIVVSLSVMLLISDVLLESLICFSESVHLGRDFKKQFTDSSP